MEKRDRQSEIVSLLREIFAKLTKSNQLQK